MLEANLYHVMLSKLYAVRKLYSTLAAQDPFLSPEPFPIAPSPPLDEARAPCHDDRCIFESNITPFTRTPSSLALQKPPSKQNKKKEGASLEKDQGRAVRKTTSTGSALNPLVQIQSMEDYQAAWHDSSDPSVTGSFPSSMADFQRTSNWYLAVNGRHPSVKTLANNATTCWLTPGNLDKAAYFGLNLLGPKRVRSVKITASVNLGNIVGRGQEDLTAESWEVWTKDVPEATRSGIDISDASIWTRRALKGTVTTTRIGDSALYEHSFVLTPGTSAYQDQGQPDSDTDDESRLGRQPEGLDDEVEEVDQILRKRALEDETYEEENTEQPGISVKGRPPRALVPVDMDDIQEGSKIEGIRFISRDRKSQPIRVCGFEIDGWVI